MTEPAVKENELHAYTLYDSDTFAVMHLLANAQDEGAPEEPAVPTLARHGFEIVDKRRGKEVYLDGSWAEMFQQQINRLAGQDAHPGRSRGHAGELQRTRAASGAGALSVVFRPFRALFRFSLGSGCRRKAKDCAAA
jgi:hypothetical protein